MKKDEKIKSLETKRKGTKEGTKRPQIEQKINGNVLTWD